MLYRMSPPPRPPTLGYLIWRLALAWRVAVDRALAPLGLTHAHYALLASLYAFSRDGARPSQRELADFAGLEVMYVSKLVRGLEHGGLLRRSDHPGDPRAFQLELTTKGDALIVQAAVVVRDVHDRLSGPIGGRASARTDALMRVLEGLLDHAEGLNRPNRPRVRATTGSASTAPKRRRDGAGKRRSR
jgi:MarR family transcriptional regulator, organic hydroperoxide resistance regulator